MTASQKLTSPRSAITLWVLLSLKEGKIATHFPSSMVARPPFQYACHAVIELIQHLLLGFFYRVPQSMRSTCTNSALCGCCICR